MWLPACLSQLMRPLSGTTRSGCDAPCDNECPKPHFSSAVAIFDSPSFERRSPLVTHSFVAAREDSVSASVSVDQRDSPTNPPTTRRREETHALTHSPSLANNISATRRNAASSSLLLSLSLSPSLFCESRVNGSIAPALTSIA